MYAVKREYKMKFKFFKVFGNTRGDTMVEVLMSVAIVGAVITGAYGLASHSLQEGISASEHTQALKLAEGQIEALKFRYSKTIDTTNDWASSAFVTSQDFCLDATATAPVPAVDWNPQANAGGVWSPTDLKVGASNYNLKCVNPANAATAKYFINITKSTVSNVAGPTYLVVVRWTPPGDGPQSQTQLYYRF
jgi:Tfp pilus assembly protein PilV